MQLDVFVVQHNLAFEYQGEQHYFDSYHVGPQWAYSELDKEKKEACIEKAITLIEVPYWWDFKQESLIATIHRHRIDLFPQATSKPIPSEPPKGFPKGTISFR
jgi:hypothetical protein